MSKIEKNKNNANVDESESARQAQQVEKTPKESDQTVLEAINEASEGVKLASSEVKEIGGPKGLEPTRYGDWEAKGRCYDF